VNDLCIYALLLFVAWLFMLWAVCERKDLTSLLILMLVGFPLQLAVLHFTWGPVLGEWLAAQS
jgi:hypothetical protein